MRGIDGGALAVDRSELVANSVLDAERHKFKAREPAPVGSHTHFDRVDSGEPVRPSEIEGGSIDVLLGLIRSMTDFPEHPACDVTPEIHPIHRRPRCFETHAC